MFHFYRVPKELHIVFIPGVPDRVESSCRCCAGVSLYTIHVYLRMCYLGEGLLGELWWPRCDEAEAKVCSQWALTLGSPLAGPLHTLASTELFSLCQQQSYLPLLHQKFQHPGCPFRVLLASPLPLDCKLLEDRKCAVSLLLLIISQFIVVDHNKCLPNDWLR